MALFKSFSVVVLISFVSGIQASSQHCKCSPKDSCWPSSQEWDALNATLCGQLIQAIPPASVCYTSEPNYNPTSCTYVLSQWHNSSFQALDPTSIDYPYWAGNPCPPVYPNGTSVNGDPAAGARGCSLGEYPSYVVNATGPDDIAAAVKWAEQKNIRLVVKATGHSLAGRSTAYGSLSIWTHNIRGIQFNADFKPDSCPLNGTGPQMAATIAAGEVDLAVYEAMAEHDAVVVCGGNPDVGIMGWFTGGGHGPLSSTYGMGADNLLQATVVTPTGDIVTTNACLHPELFFAIRGGGGCTYGIVVEAVMKAYPTPQTTIHSLQLGWLSTNNSDQFWDLMAWVHSEFPRLKDGGMQGYYYMVGAPSAPTLSMTWTFYLYDKPNGTADALFAPIKERLDSMKDLLAYTVSEGTLPSFLPAYKIVTTPETVANAGSAIGSRLLPGKALADIDAVARVFKEIGPLPTFKTGSNSLMIGSMIANSNNRGLDIGLNPAWRDAVTHFIVAEGWLDNASPAVIQSVRDDITYNKTYALRQLAPDSGAYFNEMDPFEPEWQWSFFGPNYQRLRAVKEKYDPDGVLWCISCVGSEDWIEQADGTLCRAKWSEWDSQQPLPK